MESKTQPLGGIRDDLISVLSLAFGGSKTKARAKLNALEGLIRDRAKSGAEEAIPTIKQEVRKEIRPYMIGAFSVGGLALLIGVGALIIAWRKR